MFEYHNSRPARIIGPKNEILTRDTLPPPNTSRWVASRKAQVVAAVESGLLTIDQVMARYNLSLEEFCAWQHAMDRAGIAGLRVGWAQQERAGQRREHKRRKGTLLRLVTH